MKKIISIITTIIILIGALSMGGVQGISFEQSDYFVAVNDAPTQYTASKKIGSDGNLAIARDKNGVMWGAFGHTSDSLAAVSGYKITIWKGTATDNLQKQYDAKMNFVIGPAGTSFNGIKYPSGVLSRGAIWFVGLYIDENGKFWGYVHNETGWHTGNNSGYKLDGKARDDNGEPDFRSMGLITSVDQGKTWNFEKWIVTSHENPYTNLYQPDNNRLPDAQSGPIYCLGAGDACIFVNDNDGYIYMYYSMIFHVLNAGIDPNKGGGDYVYVARAPKNDPSNFKKYYNGTWNEPGVGGNETRLIGAKTAIPSVAYSTYLKKYVMFTYDRYVWLDRNNNPSPKPPVQYCVSDDLVTWSEPILVDYTPSLLVSEVYWSVYSSAPTGNPKFIGKSFYLFHNMFANDVKKMTLTTKNSETKTYDSSSDKIEYSDNTPQQVTSTADSQPTFSEETGSTVKNRVKKYKLVKKGNTGVDDTNDIWLIIFVVSGAVILLSGGVAVIIFIRKKKAMKR